MSSYHNLKLGHNPINMFQTILLPFSNRYPYLVQEMSRQSTERTIVEMNNWELVACIIKSSAVVLLMWSGVEGYLTSTVWHETSGWKLPHVGINKRVPGNLLPWLNQYARWMIAPDVEKETQWSSDIPSSTLSPRFKQRLVLTPLGYDFPRTSYNNNLQPSNRYLTFQMK
jgi:hypothetical protein